MTTRRTGLYVWRRLPLMRAPTLREIEHKIAGEIADRLSAENEEEVLGPQGESYRINVSVTLTPAK